MPSPVGQMVKAMALYAAGASFSQLGRWFGGRAKSTMYTWVIGLALAVWPVIRGWVWSQVKGLWQYVGEKWINIHTRWHYLFVSIDDDSWRLRWPLNRLSMSSWPKKWQQNQLRSRHNRHDSNQAK